MTMPEITTPPNTDECAVAAAASGSPCPRRRFVLKLDLGADTYNELCSALRNIWLQMDRHQYGSPVISGGYNSGFILEWTEDTAITHDSYVEANDAWLDAGNTQPVPQ